MSLFSNSYRVEYEYLLMNAPLPSRAVLENDNYVRYTRSKCASSHCVTWHQPLEFVVNESKTQWNELTLDNKVFSDVLKDVRNLECVVCPSDTNECFCSPDIIEPCGVESTCDPFKYGLTATDVKSDIVLYTDFFETATEVHYLAQGDFTLSAVLSVFDFAKDQLKLNYTDRSNLFTNVANDDFKASIALFPKVDALLSKSEVGFLRPNAFTTAKWNHTMTGNTPVSSIDSVVVKDSGYLRKTGKEYLTQFDVSDLKNDRCGKGHLQCAFEPFQKVTIPLNEKNLCNGVSLTANECHDYKTDIFGNAYLLMKNYGNSFPFIDTRHRLYGGPVLVKCVNGETYDIFDLFFSNVTYSVNTPFDILMSSLRNPSGYPLIEAIDVFHDTLIISSAYDSVAIIQLYMDYETGKPYVIRDNCYFLPSVKSLGSRPVPNRWFFDKTEKKIYFGHQTYSTYQVNIFTYSLNDNTLTVDSDNFVSDIRAFSGAVAYNPTSRRLVYFTKGSASSLSPSALQFIGIIEYQKVGNTFKYVDSLKLTSTGINAYTDIIGAYLSSDGTKYLRLEDHSSTSDPSKVYTIRL